MDEKLQIAIDFINEITDASGRFTYLDNTIIVSEARQILELIKGNQKKT